MPYEKQREFDDTNTGVLEVNKKKGEMTSMGRPDDRDYTGKINIDGRWFWLSGKRREGQYGKFISLKKGKPVEPRRSQTHVRDDEENRRVMSGDDFL
jgi:hypothetical protein